jgi:N6-adenosine-specific RNA methylase IME4
MTDEQPNIVYGRLLEAAHFTGYGIERMAGGLEWLLDEGRWRNVGPGFDDVRRFMASVKPDELSLDERKSIARKLAREHDLSIREAARVTGIGKSTLHYDIAGRPRVDAEPAESPEPSEVAALDRPRVDAEPIWLDQPAEAVADRMRELDRRAARDAERERQLAVNAELVAGNPLAASLRADSGRYPTIVIDPPWDPSDQGDVNVIGRANPTYAVMPLEEIAELPVGDLAADNAHLYLWITNRALRSGFGLLERWGFRYVTMLTWVKPVYGIGNYFRGSTEQVLFGVRGSLQLLRQDVGTHFHAPRSRRHSEKPDVFYELVESCSPGPWLELFSRSERPGWEVKGAEVPA